MKILFLGIDALDRLILDDLADELPNFAQLRREGIFRKVRSTVPPDSDTAWATIMTGLNPAQHGIVHFVDPLEKVNQLHNVGNDNEVLRGKTFWELLGYSGLKAHAVFPHLCYPVWDTPGVMVARGASTVNGARVPGAGAHPPEVLADYPNPDTLLGMGGFPDRGVDGLTAYAKYLCALTRADADFALKLLKQLDWDMFFFYLPTIDGVGHYFWSFYDQTYPGFVDGHPLQRVIPDLYKLCDKILGEFLSAIDDEVVVMVLSDHGHGARPFNLVNVNDILREAGFLKARNMKLNPHLNLFEKTKRVGVEVVSRYGLAKAAGKILKHVPQVKESLTRPSKIKWDETIAYASDLSGIKAYTYGGIIINREVLGQRDYEGVRGEIIELLKEKCVLDDGTSLIDFIARREDVYTGPFSHKYPDIVLEFKYGYGLGWDVNVPLFTRAPSQNLVPGSHRGATGTFLMRSPYQVIKDAVDLHDITPTILDLMHINPPRQYMGKSILIRQ